MAQASVPIVPGYHGEAQEEEVLAQKADEIGYPLLVKAVLGGGGKGMKLSPTKKEFMVCLCVFLKFFYDYNHKHAYNNYFAM